ncbi:MAG TPA: ABC-2 family transporter protein [Acidimicrobiia bacterium]|nr:ABC-2 family transporter protein [Acidimicrobiia bacterium]
MTTRSFFALVKTETAVAVEYRARILIWVLSSVFPLLLLAVWLSVKETSGERLGWSREELIGYYFAAAVIAQLTSSFLTWAWDEDMRSGALSIRLLRPMHPFYQYLAREVGFRLVMAGFLVPSLVVVTLGWDDLSYSLTPTRGLFVILAVVSGFLLNVLISMTFATAAFWSTQMANLYSLWWGAGAFLSGWIAPTELLPGPVRAASYVLPFRSSMGLPLDILVGRATAAQSAAGLLVTAIWFLVFIVAFVRLWRAGLRHYQAVSG